jgi:hypothetical protein
MLLTLLIFKMYQDTTAGCADINSAYVFSNWNVVAAVLKYETQFTNRQMYDWKMFFA